MKGPNPAVWRWAVKPVKDAYSYVVSVSLYDNTPGNVPYELGPLVETVKVEPNPAARQSVAPGVSVPVATTRDAGTSRDDRNFFEQIWDFVWSKVSNPVVVIGSLLVAGFMVVLRKAIGKGARRRQKRWAWSTTRPTASTSPRT
jgi:hypothetical protein